ncbi:uncharacterized protein [Zea mays]|uniref:uncharacterized protein isoform X3 n=1 Tax=Zea mays TaxID=4577 RepID=UPI0009A9C566|nr:uncharacterized protein LOC100381574 isoform X3 [Zea mays]|eukprot:XP_020398991.1 uncharacterized protein LOC100381574 isoform X2 [Zea mays]
MNAMLQDKYKDIKSTVLCLRLICDGAGHQTCRQVPKLMYYVPGQRGPTDGNGISIEPWWRSPRCNFLSTLRILFQCFRSLLQFLGRVPPAGISMRPWWRSPRWHDATPLLPCARWCSGGTANAIPADIVAASVSDLRGCAASAVTDPGGCRPAGSAPASTTALGGYTAGVSVPPPPPAAEG